MTSENDATYQSCFHLSKDDPKLSDLKYEVGDMFVHTKPFDESWDAQMLETLNKMSPLIIVVDSYVLTEEGEISYRVKFVHPEQEWKWYLNDEILSEYFRSIGKDIKALRFLLME